MADQVIIRRKVTSNFTVLDNALITDKRLSWKALGLLTFLLSLPPDFKLRLNHLSKQRSTGRDATRSGLKELEETGYLVIAVERHVNGKFACTTWTVSDRATDAPNSDANNCPKTSPRSENPKSAIQEADKPQTAKPASKNPTLTSSTTQKELTLQRTTTTEQSIGLEDTLTFPAVSPKELESIKQIISTVPLGMRQDLLDEIEGKRRAGKLKNGAVALIRYLSQNIERFLLIDGHSIQQQRESRKNREILDVSIKKENEDQSKNLYASLAAMTDEEFIEKHRMLPENIRKRMERLRQEEIYKIRSL
jgi:hypothetical protein